MKYMVNVWQSCLNNGTAPVFVGTSKKKFKRACEMAVKKYGAYKNLARLIVTEEITIFSFADNGDAFYTWSRLPLTKKPERMELIRL